MRHQNRGPETIVRKTTAGTTAGLMRAAAATHTAEPPNRPAVCSSRPATMSSRTVAVVWPPTRKTVQNGWYRRAAPVKTAAKRQRVASPGGMNLR
jgi:hypothetical protein